MTERKVFVIAVRRTDTWQPASDKERGMKDMQSFTEKRDYSEVMYIQNGCLITFHPPQ